MNRSVIIWRIYYRTTSECTMLIVPFINLAQGLLMTYLRVIIATKLLCTQF